MGRRVRHYHYGIGTIVDERNLGHEKQVRFDSGECLWLHIGALSTRIEGELHPHISEVNVDNLSASSLQTDEDPIPNSDSIEDFSYYTDYEENDNADDDPSSANRSEEELIEDTPPYSPIIDVLPSEDTREKVPEIVQLNKQPSLSQKSVRSLNETYLNIIAIIIGVIFITAVIIATAPSMDTEESGDSGILKSEVDTYNGTPLAFAMLSKYFGTSVVVINTSPEMPVEPEPETVEPVMRYDDDLFLSTISKQGIPLTIITMQSIIAIDQSNTKILNQNVDSLNTLASESFTKVERMSVSSNQIQRKNDFQQSMVKFISAASYLQRGLPTSPNERRSALNLLSTATELLDSALRDLGVSLNETGERDLYTIQLSLISEPAKPDDLLPRGTPFIYMDATRSNEISIYPRSVREQSAFWHESTTGTVHLTAPAGKAYIIVLIQVTHRGNLDGKRYTIQTPALSAFTLHGGGDTFTPLQVVPAETSLGVMYRSLTLNRKETSQSSIIFEVPYSLNPKDTYISINLGSTWGTPVWDLE